MTASLLRSSWSILAVQWSDWFQLFIQYSLHSVSFPSSWALFRGLRFQLLSLSPLRSTTFSVPGQGLGINPALLSPLCSRLAWIKRSLCISKSKRISWVSFSWTNSSFCGYHLSVRRNLQWITFFTQSCLFLYCLFWQLIALTYYGINRFIYITTYPIIIIIIIYSLKFFPPALADVFHWRLSDSKSSQVSRTLLSILAVLSNVVIWIVSTRPSTSKSSRPFNNL